MQKRILAPLASASAVALAMAVGPAVAHTGDQQGRSSADITVEDCLVESSKDISYIAFHDDGEEIDKQEFDDEGGTFDLASVEGIDDVDTVEVKSGTTVEEFEIECVPDDTSGGDETKDDGTDEDDGKTDDDGKTSQGRSEADITLEDCLIQSSKDISYIAFHDDGEQIDKQEFDDEGGTFDLTSVEGIDDVDEIDVKAGTTIETFAVDCPTETAGDEDDHDTSPDETDDTDKDQGDDTTPDDTTPDEDTDTMDRSEATITVDDCLVESSKDISYIAYFDDGTQVDKENINSETFDLSTVDGIDEIDSVEVKSGTTVEDFAIDCASGDGSTDTSGEAADDTDHSDDTTSDDTESHDDADHEAEKHDDADHESDDDEKAEDEEEHESDDADDTSDDEEEDGEDDH